MANSRALAHPLRRLIIFSYIPALPLCIVSGAVNKRPFPAVAIAPMTVSAILSFAFLASARESDPRSIALGRDNVRQRIIKPLFLAVFDALWAAGLFVMLIFSWICMDRWIVGGQIALASYTTIPVMVVTYIHAHLAVLGFADLTGLTRVFRNVFRPNYCANCHEPLSAISQIVTGFAHSRHRRDGYVSIDRAGDLYADIDAGEIGDEEARTGISAQEPTIPSDQVSGVVRIADDNGSNKS